MLVSKNVLVFLAVASSCCSPSFVSAHRPLPQGVTCSSQFNSSDTALTVPDPTISWSSKRIFTCDEPIFWLEAQADADQTLHFTSTVPVIDRFANVRISAALIGPGLPALSSTADSSVLPEDVVAYAQESGYGVELFTSPNDQSTCSHLSSDEMSGASTVVDGRCHFYEPFGGSNSWVVMDENKTVPETGVYKFAVYVEGGTTAKASFACCDWPEDFVAEHAMPDADCPFCGTSPDENPAYSSLYYEHKSMAQYGGFPPAVSCSEPGADELEPTEEQCPPPPESGVGAQPASCALGCSIDGECHSHNALGGCVHELEWDLQPMFGDAPVSKVTIFKGDKILFAYSGQGNAHNLFELADASSLDECNFTDAVALANVVEVRVGHLVEFDKAGEYFFSCGIGCTGFPEEATSRQDDSSSGFDPNGCHCSIGQKLTVEVKDSTEGLRCHDHPPFASQEGAAPEPLSCADGEVIASTVNNTDFGAMDETLCAEFCTPQVALQYMPDVEIGSCSENGFTYDPVLMNITMPGSPQDVLVRITSSEEPSTCHCHSYEQIVCPEVETPEDTLYDEHIVEIEEFCTGILNGTEQDCPYKCFQPMEVLHLHYLECPSREVDPTYIAVNATKKCHIAAQAPKGTDCPEVDFKVAEGGGIETTASATSGAVSNANLRISIALAIVIGLSPFLHCFSL